MPRPISAPASDHRLAARVAWMYHEQGIKQTDIADELHISQSRVSRLLKRAVELGFVRTVVYPPPGVYTELELELEAAHGLAQCIVIDSWDAEEDLNRDLGFASAQYLESSLISGERIGISSWSATWLNAVRFLAPFRKQVAESVVQLVGGMGSAGVQAESRRLLDGLARATGATPIFLPTPGILATPAARASLMEDPAVMSVTRHWDDLTVALVGIGSVEPSPLLRASGNAVPETLGASMSEHGAVGDICLRYYDAEGKPLDAAFGIDDRIAGISEAQFRAIPRRVAAAGGVRKLDAIRGALRGGWINVLITDTATARALREG